MVVSNNLHVCFIASLDSIHTRRWIKYFSDLGYVISVIDYSDFSIPDNIDLLKNMSVYKPLKLITKSTLLNLLIRVLLIPINNWKISSILKAINPDILHSHYINDWSFIGAWNYQGTLITTAWGSDVLSKSPTARITKIFKSYVMKKSSIITCDGNHIRDSIETFGVDPSKIQLINFGTDTQLFHPKHRESQHNIRLLNKSSINIISLRNLEPIYDVTSLILATPKVLARHPQTSFIICGSGSDKRKLQQLAKSLGTEDNITFTGKIHQDDLPKLLANADIYVSTALSDAGLAASTAESMASGTPVIVTEGSDNHLWVDNGNSGFLVPPKNPAILAEKIIDLIENPETRKIFGENGRTKIVANNDWNTEMSKMKKIYEDLK
jgi:glycosyltransferase involved in cell wall biosynthesis